MQDNMHSKSFHTTSCDTSQVSQRPMGQQLSHCTPWNTSVCHSGDLWSAGSGTGFPLSIWGNGVTAWAKIAMVSHREPSYLGYKGLPTLPQHLLSPVSPASSPSSLSPILHWTRNKQHEGQGLVPGGQDLPALDGLTMQGT